MVNGVAEAEESGIAAVALLFGLAVTVAISLY